jgi:hypothetical protein
VLSTFLLHTNTIVFNSNCTQTHCYTIYYLRAPTHTRIGACPSWPNSAYTNFKSNLYWAIYPTPTHAQLLSALHSFIFASQSVLLFISYSFYVYTSCIPTSMVPLQAYSDVILTLISPHCNNSGRLLPISNVIPTH